VQPQPWVAQQYQPQSQQFQPKVQPQPWGAQQYQPQSQQFQPQVQPQPWGAQQYQPQSQQYQPQQSGHSRFTDGNNEKGEFLNPITGFAKQPLLSLTDSLSLVKKSVEGLDGFIWVSLKWAKSMKSIPYGLSVDEAAAINIYTREWATREDSLYYILNKNLREANRQLIKPFFPYLKLFLTALKKVPKHKGPVWRGVEGNLLPQYQKGQELFWWGCSSCTTDMKSLALFLGKGPRTLFNIHCNNSVNIKILSQFQTEDEVLLPPATYLEVTNVFDAENGLMIIELKEVPPPFDMIDV